MSRRLQAAGHTVTMVCGTYSHGDPVVVQSQRVAEVAVDGIRVLRVAEPYGNEMGFGRRLRAFRRFASTAKRVVTELDADVVFATSTPLTVGIPGLKAARKLHVPFVFEVRDLWPELAIALGVLKNPVLIALARRMERRIYRAARRVIALAPGIKEGVCRRGISPDRVPVIPNGADVDLFRPAAQRRQDERFGSIDEFRLVFAGAHGLANGLDAVLDAAAELKHRGERGIRFVFIGEGSQKARWMSRSAALGLGEMTSWISSMPKHELAELLPQFDVGLMILKNVPSFYQGTSPNKFFDYLASGLPVLNNYPGWLAELIQEHECGLAVPPDDPVAFAQAVLHLRENPSRLRAMGQRARRLAEERFSRDLLGARFVQVLEDVHEEWSRQRRRRKPHRHAAIGPR